MRGLFLLTGASRRNAAVDQWLDRCEGELGHIARHWVERLRTSGPDVEDVMHDGCPTACVQGAAFAYVGLFSGHVAVGFFHGAALPDAARLLQGTGKYMRHVKLRPGSAVDAPLAALLDAAYADIRRRLRST